MPAGKSPNNAFILHKEKMTAVFRTITNSTYDRNEFSAMLMEALEPLDKHLSTCTFYWVNSNTVKSLFSKGWQRNEEGEWPSRYHSGEKRHVLINKVRDYYTDGVRAIGAME